MSKIQIKKGNVQTDHFSILLCLRSVVKREAPVVKELAKLICQSLFLNPFSTTTTLKLTTLVFYIVRLTSDDFTC